MEVWILTMNSKKFVGPTSSDGLGIRESKTKPQKQTFCRLSGLKVHFISYNGTIKIIL